MSVTPETDITTRERILRETWRLLEERRGQSVRLEDIAKAAGVSRQALYLHFGSRSELFIATARHVDDQLHLMERIQEACEAEANRGIEALITWWANYVPDIYGLARALLTLRETDEAAAAAWADRMQAMYSGFRTAMQSIADCGLLSADWDTEQAADFLWALLSIETWERLTIDRGWSKEQYIERMQLAARRALIRQEL
ncbi:MAG TPA: TetR/AcrR family transcriptional regulator [Ktedonobacterales bacterium]